MKILLTGANGFIGRALSEKLTQAGYWIRGATRDTLKQNIHVSEICSVGDIGWETDWSKALEGIDVVIHLAARAHVLAEPASDPIAEFRRVNVGGTESLAKQCIKNGVGKFITLSSVGVNGERTVDEPFTEISPVNPVRMYARTKLEAEMVLHGLEEKGDLSCVIIRPPLVYGPGCPGNFFRLLSWIERGIPLPLLSVKNKRSFVGIDNLVDFVSRCVDHPAAAGETFFVSDGEDISTPELIGKLAGYMGCKTRLFPFPLKMLRLLGRATGTGPSVERLTESFCIDIDKAQTVLDWKPTHSLDYGLKRTAEWYLGRAKT